VSTEQTEQLRPQLHIDLGRAVVVSGKVNDSVSELGIYEDACGLSPN
jgi:hypothetical protein